MSGLVPVTFEPGGQVAWVEPGTVLADAARAAGVVIPIPCGGRGVCGSCGVTVLEGELGTPDDAERVGLTRAPKGVRLACRARVDTAVRVRPVVVHGSASRSGVRTGGALVAGVDLGTTGVAAAVIDRASGREVGRASVPNRQASWGGDVLSRLSSAIAGDADALREAAELSVVEALVAAAGEDTSAIERCVIAGNSAMAGLLSGASVDSLATHPFAAPVYDRDLRSTTIAGVLAPSASIEILPPVAGFVGGDTVAVMASLASSGPAKTSLVIDIGTNAEVALITERGLTVASAAAGPAFDGSGVSCGGPAVPGAIDRVSIDGSDVQLHLIGEVGEPGWLSGSGLVSALAELRRAGALSADGLLLHTDALSGRMGVDDAGVRYVRLGHAGGCPVLTQLDVRGLQLAKGAVRVAVETVLRRAKVRAKKIDSVTVAGAFGSSLAVRDLVELGVLPRQLQDRTRVAGNASLLGAVTIALHPEAGSAALERLRGSDHVSLAEGPGFSAALMAAVTLEPYDA